MFDRLVRLFCDEPCHDDEQETIWRATTYHPDRCRYYFDSRLNGAPEWLQYDTDQDAWYFGIWVNKVELAVITYAEGDITFQRCKTPEAFNKLIDKMNEFYQPGKIASTLDDDGTWTVYHQDRDAFKIA